MKLLHLLIPLVLLCGSLYARDINPDYWLENVTATDGSVQQCLVFRSIPGVLHTVLVSETLTDWQPYEIIGQAGQIYGLGGEIVVPLRQFTPPSPPPPGGGGGNPPPPGGPAILASLVLRHATGGGTLASWRSFDHEGSVTVHLEDDLHEDWQHTPLFWNRYGNYHLFIWQPGTTPAAPPQEAPRLSPADQDFLELLQDRFDDINAQVAAATAAARNAPPPVPPAPGSKKFLKILSHWKLDSDDDGVFDWIEFEVMADPQHPDHLLADPFNADVDQDGIADGEQTDFDQDGTVNNADSAVADNTVSTPNAGDFRYAFFPITNAVAFQNAKKAIQLNDRGTVLFPNGTWSGGKWTELVDETDTFDSCRALGINDHDEVAGWGNHLFHEDPEVRGMVIVHWPEPSADPSPVSGDDHYATPYQDLIVGNLTPGPVLSNDGRMIAVASQLEIGGFGNPVLVPRKRAKWTLPGEGPNRTPGHEEVGESMWHALSEDIHWGFNPDNGKGALVAPGVAGELPAVPINLVANANGELQAFFRNHDARVFREGDWKMSITLGNAVDISDDGTAIAASGRHGVMPVLMDGRWRPATRTTPGLPAAWGDGAATLVDTTSRGWILARRGAGDQPDHAVMLPLRLEGRLEIDGKIVTDSVGVDAFSIGSSDPGPDVAERIWIMAPSGEGGTTVKLRAPIHPDCRLEISGQGLRFNGNSTSVEIQGEETLFTVKAEDHIASGTEIPLVLKLKRDGQEVASLSTPVAAKVMKRRTIRMKVWLIRADDGKLPEFRPTKAKLEEYLNARYEHQINAVFDCDIEARGPLGFNTTDVTTLGMLAGQYTPQAHYLETIGTEDGEGFGGEMDMIIPNNYIDTFNINLYLVGGVSAIVPTAWNAQEGKVEQLEAAGIADIAFRRCWVAAGVADGVNDPGKLDTVAHEIGHIIFGEGHPDVNTVRDILGKPIPGRLLTTEDTGPAPLPGTVMPKRLMCSGKLRRKDGSSRMIVKGEWDKAVEWFQQEIAAGRTPE